MLLKDFFINLCIFSFLVSAAVAFRVLGFPLIPSRWAKLWGGVYAGVVSQVLMVFTIPYKGFIFDLRYIPIILSFVYFGRLAGVITVAFTLMGRIWIGGDFSLSVFTLLASTLVFLCISYFTHKIQIKPYYHAYYHAIGYVIVYVFLLQLDEGLKQELGFHVLYFFFAFTGLVIGIFLLEAHNTLFSLTRRMSVLNDSLKESQQELMETIRGQQGVTFKFKKVDGKFRITMCDGQMIRRRQINPQIFLIPNWLELIPGELRPVILSHYERAWNGEEVSFELDWPERKTFLILLQPISRDGEMAEVIGSVIDISEKIRMKNALEESEAQYRLIAENTSDLIAVFRVNGRVKYLSPSHYTMLGYTPDDLMGNSFEMLIHPEDFAHVQRGLSQTIVNRQPSQLEFRCLHTDGHWVQLESRCMPVVGSQGDVEHIVVVSRDISERKKSEELLVVSEKLSVVGELAAGVAHEIRNPLTTLKGFIQLFKKGEINPIYLDLISSELDRIELITNEFLILSKPQVVHYKPKSISVIMNQVVSVLTPQSILHNINIHEDYEAGIPFLYCEENQLKQVFINMIKNAIEAMPKGGIIAVEVRRVNEQVRVRIQDEGCGIPAELIPRLGEPFYTLKEKGTGLGLMVCHKIIKEHGGSISFQSKIGQGTIVDTFLPIAKGKKSDIVV